MGKAAMCIQMLSLLNSGRVFKVSELAEALETNKRNVIEYKKEIEKAGYDIVSLSGRYGGYRLKKSDLFPVVKLSDEESTAFFNAYSYVSSRNDFLEKDALNKAVGKIASSIPPMENHNNNIYLSTSLDAKEPASALYYFLQRAITNKTVIKIQYITFGQGTMGFIVHPYQLINYKDEWYLLAWVPEKGDVFSFKFSRILSYELQNEKFTVWKYYDVKKYFTPEGFKFKKKDLFPIVFEVHEFPEAILKEKLSGINADFFSKGENFFEVHCQVANPSLTVSFLLGFGGYVKVLSPDWLKERMKKQASAILANYP
ncbi:MAG: WYL domain-containing protein [Eubacteriales bacterium]|nr:WYL domain-containing protein [Eubacteriales bacterium]